MNKSIGEIQKEFEQEHKEYQLITFDRHKLCYGKYQETDDITLIPGQLFSWGLKFNNWGESSEYSILDPIDLLNRARSEEEKNKVMQFIFNLMKEIGKSYL